MSRRVRSRCPLPAERVIVSALHTHGGPVFRWTGPAVSPIGLCGATRRRCVSAIVRLPQMPGRPSSCRRRADPDVARNRRHADGSVDRALPVLRGPRDGRRPHRGSHQLCLPPGGARRRTTICGPPTTRISSGTGWNEPIRAQRRCSSPVAAATRIPGTRRTPRSASPAGRSVPSPLPSGSAAGSRTRRAGPALAVAIV